VGGGGATQRGQGCYRTETVQLARKVGPIKRLVRSNNRAKGTWGFWVERSATPPLREEGKEGGVKKYNHARVLLSWDSWGGKLTYELGSRRAKLGGVVSRSETDSRRKKVV